MPQPYGALALVREREPGLSSVMRESTDSTVPTARRYRVFAEVEATGLSDQYEEWAAGVADDAATVALLDQLPPAKRQPNLIFSVARFLGAPDDIYSGFRRWLHANWAAVADTALSHATQTNEAARCALALPFLPHGPLALLEVGASAGLCLYPDRYAYTYRSANDAVLRHLEPLGGSPVELDCEVSESISLPDALPRVVWRAGIDLHPLDPARPEDVDWLEALVWPEHEDRRRRVAAAARIAAADPPIMVRGDLVEELPALAASAPPQARLVIFHTAVIAYLDADARQRFVDTVTGLDATWISIEGQTVMPGIAERLDASALHSTDSIVAVDGVPVAFAQPHGRALYSLTDT